MDYTLKISTDERIEIAQLVDLIERIRLGEVASIAFVETNTYGEVSATVLG